MTTLETLKDNARRLKEQIYALYLVGRDSRTPWYAKVLAICVVAYALSPIDLIPDFVPVLGYVDDLVILPLGIWLAVRLVPKELMVRAREQAALAIGSELPASRMAAATVVLIWFLLAVLAVVVAFRFFGRL